MALEWFEALENVRNFTFKIITPQGSGTGFLITLREQNICGIATAYHVIDHAYTREEPIKLLQTTTNKTLLLRAADRYVFPNPANDAAIIMFMKGDLQVNTDLLALSPEDKYLKPGSKIAWAGYPAIAPDECSFFSGHISCYLNVAKAYLVDGVAINGISGGPAFAIVGDSVQVIGSVSAYIPNRVTGECLPGVCFVTAVQFFHEFIKDLDSLEDAKQEEGSAELVTVGSVVPAVTPRPHAA